MGAALAEANPALPARDLADEMAKQLDLEASSGEIAGLLDFAISIQSLAGREEWTTDLVARAVAMAFSDSVEAEKFAIADYDPVLFESRVELLLASSYVKYRDKALRLTNAAAETVRDVHCISDLRPIFADGSDDSEIFGFLILHMLELEVVGPDSTVHYLNLDTEMVRKLVAVLQRALHKAEKLGTLIEQTGYYDLTLGEEGHDG